ncbi:MAG TPA: site-2 protease family protein, partial [Propylenella sp.]|nr:site-2 protease family protein [Propylenella sp.]
MPDFLLQSLAVLKDNVFPALIVLTAVVFVHEMGHFLVARWCGIRVAAFSIGFGRELFGFADRRGTRWKFSAIPLGGYVRFEGDENAASIPDPELLARVPPEQRQGLFHFAPLWKRVAVVAAGPLANFVLAIL